MTRRLLIVCGFLMLAAVPASVLTAAPAEAQDSAPASPPPQPQTAPPQATPPQTALPPAARLIRPPRPGRLEPRPFRPHAGPLDERCRTAKQELDLALRRPGPPRKIFQAQKADNAGTRLCREGQAEKGMAKFHEGLSNLQ